MAEENNTSQLKLDQLTEAVKGLYAKSSMSQGEIYNALTSLSQRYENLTNVSSEKIVSTIINEFRKTLDNNSNKAGENIKDLEAHLKNFVVRDNEQMNKALNDFLAEISALYQRMENQQALLKQAIDKMGNLEGENISFEVSKLSENFSSFSKGFENITLTLNKNFADFLEQLRRFNSKDEINAMKAEILSMTTNVNNAVESIKTIDNKYVSMTNLIETLSKKESEFSVAIDEFKILEEIISSIKKDVNNISTKEDFDNFGYEIKEKLENLKLEIKKANLNSGSPTEAQNNQIAYLTKEVSSVFDDFKNLSSTFSDAKGEILEVKNSISSFDIELKEIKSLLENRLPSVLGDSANEMSLENTKEELKSLIQNLTSFKEDIKAINDGNIEILQAPIEKALESFKNQDIGKNIEGLKSNLNNVTGEIQSSIQNLQDTLSNLNNVSSIQLLNQISDSIPAIADRLEIFRNQTVAENNANLNQIKDSLNRLTNTIQAQALSDTTINRDNSYDLDVLSTLKSDILEYISTLSTSNKTSHSSFENKLDKLVHNLIGNINSIATKPLNQALGDIDSKIEKTNLQQIHNAKELLEEIQNGNNVIKTRLVNIEEGRDLDSIVTLIGKIEEKINGFDKSNDKITEEFKVFKEQVSQKLKENVQKISAVVEGPVKPINTESKNTTLESLLIKIQEYLSNFEFLKDNISQELKENLKVEFNKVQSAIKKLRTTDENSNYNYTLEDVESDLAKIRLIIEKNSTQGDDFRNLFEKIVELRTVGLEGVKINRDIETELGQMAGWFKDTVDRLDDVTDKLDDIQNIGFEDIKTRLVQSEKSRTAANEFNQKIENALKHLIKNTSNQENKIVELSKKLEVSLEAQKDGFNPNQFIDIFYENMTQTKMLTNRVEIIEDKINSIQTAVEKLISYVEN